MAGGSKVLTKDLDVRLKAVEERLSELTATLGHLEEQTRQAQADAHVAASRSADAEAAANRFAESLGAVNHSVPNGNGEADDRLLRLQEVVGRLDERVEKITHTLIAQAHRFS